MVREDLVKDLPVFLDFSGTVYEEAHVFGTWSFTRTAWQ